MSATDRFVRPVRRRVQTGRGGRTPACCTARVRRPVAPCRPIRRPSTTGRRRRRRESSSARTATTSRRRCVGRARLAPTRDERGAPSSGCSPRSPATCSPARLAPTAPSTSRSTSTRPASVAPGGRGGMDRLQADQAGRPRGRPVRARESNARHRPRERTSAGADEQSLGREAAPASAGSCVTTSCAGGREQADGRPARGRGPAPRRAWSRRRRASTSRSSRCVAVRGARRSLRHGGDGRFSPDGLLHCRWPSQVPRRSTGDHGGTCCLRSAGRRPRRGHAARARSARVQPLPRGVARGGRGRAQQAGSGRRDPARGGRGRAALRRWTAVYDGAARIQATATEAARAATFTLAATWCDQLRRFSLVKGVDPDPVGVTAWSQPWVPLWLEWEVDVDARTGSRAGSSARSTSSPRPERRAGHGDAQAPRAAARSPPAPRPPWARRVRGWLVAEEERDRDQRGEADEETEAALRRRRRRDRAARRPGRQPRRPARAAARLPLRRRPRARAPAPTARRVRPPRPASRRVSARGGTPRLDASAPRRRLRPHPGPPDRAAPRPGAQRSARRARHAAPAASTDRARALAVPVRGPAAVGTEAAEATVDQVDPPRGQPGRRRSCCPTTSTRRWRSSTSPAARSASSCTSRSAAASSGRSPRAVPGRPTPARCFGLDAAQQLLGFFAAGIVAADAKARGRPTRGRRPESALSALLRAIDTTLWTVDAFARHGQRAHRRPRRPADRRRPRPAAPRDRGPRRSTCDPRSGGASTPSALADRAFPVRVGELTRADDGLLGLLRRRRLRARPHRRQGRRAAGPRERTAARPARPLGTTPHVPPTGRSSIPTSSPRTSSSVRPGQVVMLTLLMHPGGQGAPHVGHPAAQVAAARARLGAPASR